MAYHARLLYGLQCMFSCIIKFLVEIGKDFNTTMLHDLPLDLAYYHESVTFGAILRSCINAMNAVLESVQDAPRLFKISIKLIL